SCARRSAMARPMPRAAPVTSATFPSSLYICLLAPIDDKLAPAACQCDTLCAMAGRLNERNAIVTGAGSGIGAASAAGLAREGAGVVAADIDRDAAERTAAGIRQAGARAIAVQVDVARRASVEAMLEAALKEFGRIHILHSNAGISPRHHFLDLPQEEWERVLGINLTGQYLCGQVVGRHMRAAGGGSIINTSSQLGEGTGHPNMTHYLASKGGSRMLTRGMAIDLAP